jgi:hypothetical protein
VPNGVWIIANMAHAFADGHAATLQFTVPLAKKGSAGGADPFLGWRDYFAKYALA